MEKQVIISLKEYEKLSGENQRMKKLLTEKELIPLEYIKEESGFGYVTNSWNIATKDELVLKLVNERADLIIELSKARNELNRALSEVYNLKYEKQKNKWF